MEPLSFRPASEADVPFLVELRRATMAPHEVASGVVWSSEQSLSRVKAAFHTAQIIMQGDQAIGLLKVVRDGVRWELLQVQLAPAFQGHGFGSEIVRGLVAEARAAGVSLRLGVLKSNPARRVYERLGFVVIQEKERSYDMVLAAQAPEGA